MGSPSFRFGLPLCLCTASQLHFFQNIHGNVMTAQVAFLCLQTCKTMGLRVQQQCRNAQMLAEMLEKHPKVRVCVCVCA